MHHPNGDAGQPLKLVFHSQKYGKVTDNIQNTT